MSVSYPADVTVPADIMVDLETLGSGPGCAILSIGAVAFDPASGFIGATLHSLVSTRSCRALGLREEPETLQWWSRQSPEARRLLLQAQHPDAAPLAVALDSFARFIRSHGGRDRVRVWGNGADFDNAILAHLYRVTDERPPWAFWNSRCFRTFKNIAGGKDLEPTREGTHHNALDDARHQAIWACRIHARMVADHAVRDGVAA